MMKRTELPSVIALSLSCLVVCPVESLRAEDLFPDPGLEAAVRQEVFDKRYNDEPLTKEDVKNISQVKGRGQEIKDLTGMEHCLAVQEVVLEDNQISDLSPMAGLKLLQSVNLANNEIESLEPLEELNKVQLLNVAKNKIEDISPLANMTNMRTLYLSENEVKNIEVLKKLPKVWTLYLDNNPVEDFGPVGELEWLSSLDLSHCELEQVDFLKPLTELKFVNLSNNKLKNLDTLVEMAEGDEDRRFAPFWRIYLSGNPIDADSPQLEKLREMGAKVVFEPAPGHEVLQQDVGEWKAKIRIWMTPEGEVDPSVEPTVVTGIERNRMLGPFWLVSSFEGEIGGQPFEGLGTNGYDPDEMKYTGSWIDSTSPYPMHMLGKYDPEAKTLTSQTSATGMDGQPVKGESIVEYQDEDHRKMTMYEITDGEKVRSMEIVYERVK